jgi:hypothetical protein
MQTSRISSAVSSISGIGRIYITTGINPACCAAANCIRGSPECNGYNPAMAKNSAASFLTEEKSLTD